MIDLFTRPKLFTPGPTPVPLSTKIASFEDSYHRSKAFSGKVLECKEWLRPIFGSDELPIILTSSGTGAMEAAVVNFTEPKDEVLVLEGGKFGERWSELCRTYHCHTHVMKINWGQLPQIEDIKAFVLGHPNVKVIFMQVHESSTGIYNPVEKLVPQIRGFFSGLVVCDAISSMLAHSMRMEAWQIDVVVSGSQKAFSVGPGLSLLAAGSRAWAKLSSRPKYYFDLQREKKEQLEGQTAWTPATSLINQLHANLKIIHHYGVDRVIHHHEILAHGVRSAVEATNLSLFSAASPSNSLTAISIPEAISACAITKLLRDRFQMTFATGQGHMKDKMVRFSHLGFVDVFDVISGFSAFEFVLSSLGHNFEMGLGTKVLMKNILQ